MRTSLGLVLSLLILGCVSGLGGPSHREARRDLEEGRTEAAVAKLEELRNRHPDNAGLRLELGEAYYLVARKALDEGDDATYLANLELAQEELLKAVELDPRSPSPHTWMGMIAAYQSNLDSALTSFQNARRLDPRHPVHYMNIAETYIYLGKLGPARRHLERARKLGAPPVYLEINEVLAAWREGDYVEARDLFETAFALNPEIVKVWNEAPVSEPIESFEDFTRFCCAHVACGPYMAGACREMEHEVRVRSVADETLRNELRLEMERRRRLQEIYSNRKDLEVVVEKPDADGAP